MTFIKNKLGFGSEAYTEVSCAEFFDLGANLYIRNLAFQSAVNLIANSISKCEFKTYLQGKETKGKEYYLWNVEPNRNQNSSEFIHQWIDTLYRKNECLIIEVNNQLLVADSFMVQEYALYGNIFSQVSAKGFTFERDFKMDEVLYFKLNNQDVRKLVNGMYEDYGKLIEYAQKSFKKSRGERGILDIDTVAQGDKDFQKNFDDLMQQHFKKYFESENAVLPLFNGYKYTPNTSKTYSNEGTRDIRAMVDDIYDFTARAFSIPPALMRGDVADTGKAIDAFLTFCVDPLAYMSEEEINRKRNGFAGFSQGTFLKIDTKTIKHVDLLTVSSSIDKLISSGTFTINDIRRLVDEQPVDGDFANNHYITKNYATAEELLKALQGGEEN